MSEQQRKFVLLGVLGALVLGAGGWYFFIKDSGNNTNFSAQGTGERKVRVADDKKATSTRKERKSRAQTTAKTERKQRDRDTRNKRGRKIRRRGRGPTRVEKKQDSPRI